jgi:hypothetical protein
MPDYAAAQLALIDSRVAAGGEVITRMGTVTQRDSSGTRVLVIFDGSTGVPQPVKCAENVLVTQDDRVLCLKVQSDWVVIGNYLLYTLADVNEDFAWPSSSTSTSAAYVDMPNSPSVTLFKMRDFTKLRIEIQMSMFVTVTGTVVEIGANVTSGSVSYDVTVMHQVLNAASFHLPMSRTVTTPTADVSDDFTITARWLRVSGTGVMTVDSNDRISINVREVYQ